MLTHTTTALLDQLRDPSNQAVWRELDGRFRPILLSFGQRLGLTADEAADAAQETLVRVVRSYRDGHYDRARGRLSSWILGIAQHCISDVRQARSSRREMRGLSAIESMPAADALECAWNEQCEREILDQALRTLRSESRFSERTIRAFEMIAFDDRRPADVAAELGLSTNDVYLAKHRCLARLREIVAQLDDLYELK